MGRKKLHALDAHELTADGAALVVEGVLGKWKHDDARFGSCGAHLLGQAKGRPSWKEVVR